MYLGRRVRGGKRGGGGAERGRERRERRGDQER